MEEDGDGSGDLTILPLFVQFLSIAKSLAKCVATPLCDNGEIKYLHVFYGNDRFYVLFRLHQVRIFNIHYFFFNFNFFQVVGRARMEPMLPPSIEVAFTVIPLSLFPSKSLYFQVFLSLTGN